MEKADPTQQYAAQLSAVVQSLEGRTASYNARKREYEALLQMLQQLPEQMSQEVMVPVAGCAFFPGSIVHTNEILVLLGENYFVERTSSQARQIIQRRLDFIKENMQTIERQLTAMSTRRDVIDDYQREGIVDIQEEYHSDDDKDRKAEPVKAETFDSENAAQRRNMFVKAISSDKIEKSDEEYAKLERRLAELEAEEEHASKGMMGSEEKQVIVDSLEEGEEPPLQDDEDEEGEEAGGERDDFDAFYTNGDDESASDDEGEDVQPEEISDEEEDTNAGKPLKPVHLRTKTPPNPSARKLKPAHVRTNTPPVTKAAVKPTPLVAATTPKPAAFVVEVTEPIEKSRSVSFGAAQTLPPYVRPPVPPGKLKPCLAPVRPITVAAPPPKAVQWVHTSDEQLPKYKNRPPPQPQPVPVGNRARSSARLPPPPSALTKATAAMGEVIERTQPDNSVAPPPAAAAPAPDAADTGDAPKKVSRYRAALMEQRS